MKLRMMTVVGALAAMALVGCNSNKPQTAQDRQDLAQTQQNANQDVAQTRQDQQQKIDDAKQNLAETEKDARQNVAQTEQNAQQNVNDKREQLAKDEANPDKNGANDNDNATASNDHQPNGMATQSGTVLGTLTDMDSHSLTIKDSAGNKVALNRNTSTRITKDGERVRSTELKKGSEVRADFKVDKNGDKWAEAVSIQAAPQNNTLNNDQNQ